MRGLCIVMVLVGMAAAVARGSEATERTYKMKCKMCHGADGKGIDAASAEKRKLDPAKLSLDAMLKKTAEENIKMLADGEGKMPGFKEKLTAEEITALVDYCKTLASAPAGAPAAAPAAP